MEGGRQLQGMLDASKELFNFLLQLAKYFPKTSASIMKMKIPTFPVSLTSFIPPIQSALSVSPGALDRSDVNEVFPQFVPRMRAFNQEIRFVVLLVWCSARCAICSDLWFCVFLFQNNAVKGKTQESERICCSSNSHWSSSMSWWKWWPQAIRYRGNALPRETRG